MFSESSEETKEWDYKCPQFCDFSAPETWVQNKEIDSFFTIDHEKDRRQSSYTNKSFKTEELKMNDNKEEESIVEKQSLIDENNDNQNSPQTNCELKIVSEYKTPQNINKENAEESDESDVFYSTKKSLTNKKCLYNLRATPMRTLQYNGITPLRETRISSSKQKKNRKSKVLAKEELVFDMNDMIESLPNESDCNETQIETQNETQNETMDERKTQNIVNENENTVNENEKSSALVESNEIPTTGRVSYVIQPKVHKTVQLISPVKSIKKVGSAKMYVNSIRRKGTPIRRSTVQKKVRSQSVSTSLYSAVKTSNDKYKSMAELVNEFETKPRGYDRSRSLERNTSGQRSRSSSVSSLTRPISPKLHAIHRHRCNSNQLETEEMIAQEIKKYSFKANPIRKKLFDAKYASGIPIVKSTKAPTKAIGMSFQTQKRNEIRSTKSVSNDDKSEHNEKILFRATPMPSFKKPFHVIHSENEKKVTSFKPFSFDARDKNPVIKKRANSEDILKSSQNSNIRKSFKF